MPTANVISIHVGMTISQVKWHLAAYLNAGHGNIQQYRDKYQKGLLVIQSIDQSPLLALKKHCGGTCVPFPKHGYTYYTFQISGARLYIVMKNLLPFLSTRREDAVGIIAMWENHIERKKAHGVKAGHAIIMRTLEDMMRRGWEVD